MKILNNPKGKVDGACILTSDDLNILIEWAYKASKDMDFYTDDRDLETKIIAMRELMNES